MSADQKPVTVLISPQGDQYATADPREVNNLTLGHGYRYAPENAPTSAPDDPKPLDLTSHEPSTRKRAQQAPSPAREPGQALTTDGGE